MLQYTQAGVQLTRWQCLVTVLQCGKTPLRNTETAHKALAGLANLLRSPQLCLSSMCFTHTAIAFLVIQGPIHTSYREMVAWDPQRGSEDRGQTAPSSAWAGQKAGKGIIGHLSAMLCIPARGILLGQETPSHMRDPNTSQIKISLFLLPPHLRLCELTNLRGLLRLRNKFTKFLGYRRRLRTRTIILCVEMKYLKNQVTLFLSILCKVQSPTEQNQRNCAKAPNITQFILLQQKKLVPQFTNWSAQSEMKGDRTAEQI